MAAAVVIVSGAYSYLNYWVLNDGGDGIYDDSDDDYIIGGGEFGKKEGDVNKIVD
ncbi:predicted protein [Arabidopsis lyrata subsp. lyrata]|uniref:Predicted protein n=1 Tax=Arabidopsis lyrata subsp. lyrata TaxID=81972 RepID=D7M4Z0_ARALL|nr:predicted protein [Arabidopsis lyrata subsp. lyrata]